MDLKFWVYIMASLSGTLYIGITNDLDVRVRQHKAGEIEGFQEISLHSLGLFRELRQRIKGDQPRKTTKRLATFEEDCAD